MKFKTLVLSAMLLLFISYGFTTVNAVSRVLPSNGAANSSTLSNSNGISYNGTGEHNQCGSSADRTTHDCGDRKGCSTQDPDDCISNYITPTVEIIPSNVILDGSQTETFTITVNNGIGPFNVELFNITGNKQQGQNITVYAPGGSNTVSFVTSTAGLFGFKAIAIDKGKNVASQFSSIVNSIRVYDTPTITAIPDGHFFDSGQTITFTFTVYGGVGPFNIELFNMTGNSQQGSNVTVFSPNGSNTLSFTAGAVGVFSYNAIATDTGTTTPFVFNSIPDPLGALP